MNVFLKLRRYMVCSVLVLVRPTTFGYRPGGARYSGPCCETYRSIRCLQDNKHHLMIILFKKHIVKCLGLYRRHSQHCRSLPVRFAPFHQTHVNSASLVTSCHRWPGEVDEVIGVNGPDGRSERFGGWPDGPVC